MNNQVANAISLLEQATPQLDVERIGTHIPDLTVLSEGYVQVGRLDEAGQIASGALNSSRQRKELGIQAYCLRVLGEVACRRTPADIGLAETHFRAALNLAQTLEMGPLQAHCHLSLGKLYRRMGRPDEARAELTRAAEMLRAMGMTFWLPEAETELGALSP
jgi:hypothetical protein